MSDEGDERERGGKIFLHSDLVIIMKEGDQREYEYLNAPCLESMQPRVEVSKEVFSFLAHLLAALCCGVCFFFLPLCCRRSHLLLPLSPSPLCNPSGHFFVSEAMLEIRSPLLLQSHPRFNRAPPSFIVIVSKKV